MLHDEFLELARHALEIDSESESFTQAALRRAVSTAYYALFHLLVHEATSMLMADPTLQPPIARTFEHSRMVQACQAFAKAAAANRSVDQLNHYSAEPIPPDIGQVARAFINLQGQRFLADYKIDHELALNDAFRLVQQAEQAFEAWQRVRETPAARAFLASLAFWKRWRMD